LKEKEIENEEGKEIEKRRLKEEDINRKENEMKKEIEKERRRTRNYKFITSEKCDSDFTNERKEALT